MIHKSKTVVFVPTANPGKAEAFFSKKLGLRLISKDPFALVYALQDSTLRVTPIPKHAPVGHTILGWEVAGIKAEIKALLKRGVAFERFGGFQQDELGIWTAPGGAKVAWFKDADGNLLSLTQPEPKKKAKKSAPKPAKGFAKPSEKRSAKP